MLKRGADMIFTKGLAKTLETYESWWAGELDRPILPVVLTGVDPGREPPKHRFEHQKSYNDINISPEELVDSVDYDMQCLEFIGDAYPYMNTSFVGAGGFAAMLGAKTKFDGSIWFYVDNELPIEDIHFEYDENNFWLKRIKSIMEIAQQRWGDSVVISMPDLGGVFDILASFRGTQNLLFDLYDSPDEVKRVVDEIKVLWHRCYNELTEFMTAGYYTDWSGILSAKRSYMMQSDFCYMLGREMFDEFVLPELADTCAFLDRGCFHLDGVGQIPFVDSLINIAKVDLIQWIPGDGPHAAGDWFDLYCKILDAGIHLQLVYDDGTKNFDKVISHYGTGKRIVRSSQYYPISKRDEALEFLSRYGVD